MNSEEAFRYVTRTLQEQRAAFLSKNDQQQLVVLLYIGYYRAQRESPPPQSRTETYDDAVERLATTLVQESVLYLAQQSDGRTVSFVQGGIVRRIAEKICPIWPFC